MDNVEVHLNRRGINSIETPQQQIEIEAGSLLLIQLINHGAPLHITLQSPNSQMFTGFYHENVYVRETAELKIQIYEDAYAGFFDIEVITGYGAKRAIFRIFVKKFIEKEVFVEEQTLSPKEPRPRRPWATGILLVAAIGCYAAWWLKGMLELNIAAFVLLILGVLAAWRHR
jgi:hypothetical protein